MKEINRNKPEYIDKLPNNTFEIKYYDNMFQPLFNRYWFDVDNNRIIMKDKRNNKFKIVNSMKDKQNETFAILFDINGNKAFVNYGHIISSNSIGYYLQPDFYDDVVKYSKEVFQTKQN